MCYVHNNGEVPLCHSNALLFFPFRMHMGDMAHCHRTMWLTVDSDMSVSSDMIQFKCIGLPLTASASTSISDFSSMLILQTKSLINETN